MRKCILVVDDEEFTSASISRFLRKEGYTVVTARNFGSAVNAIEHNNLDMIISDIMMPYTGGFDLVDFVKSRGELQKIPVILISGMDEDVLQSSICNAEAVLSKPFDIYGLLKLVNSILNKNNTC